MPPSIIIGAVLLAGALLLPRWRRRIRALPITELELAFTQKKVHRLLQKWNDNAAVRKSIYVDYVVIPCYAAVFWFLCNLVEGRRFALAALAAGALDFFVENPVMLLELGGRSNAVLTFVKALASLIKWLLLGAVLIFLVYAVEEEL
jgi:hypothetical protein